MGQPILLGVNIDHAATLRQARYRESGTTCGGMVEPDPVLVARLAERAGADGITVHLREDRRHIQERDVHRLRESIQTRLNLEMAATAEMVKFALDLRPETVCVVPESREEVTTEGGLDAAGMKDRLKEVVDACQDNGIDVSLFIDPEAKQIDAAAELGARYIELHTGAFANAYYGPGRQQELQKLQEAAVRANGLDLIVNAGHGINYVNIAAVRGIPMLHELNIGHSILARAVLTGIEEAVAEMRLRMNESHG